MHTCLKLTAATLCGLWGGGGGGGRRKMRFNMCRFGAIRRTEPRNPWISNISCITYLILRTSTSCQRQSNRKPAATASVMGNLFGKDCPDVKKKPKKRSGVGWKPPGAGCAKYTRCFSLRFGHANSGLRILLSPRLYSSRRSVRVRQRSTPLLFLCENSSGRIRSRGR